VINSNFKRFSGTSRLS